MKPADLAKEYTRLGADMISVVTAPSFGGDKEWIKDIRKVTNLPILRKDFLYTADELKETKDLGADQVLLIAQLFTFDELDTLCFHANRIGLKPVIEVQQVTDLMISTKVDAHRILINNRNLRTGKINMLNAFNMIHLVSNQYELTTASGYDIESNMITKVTELGFYDNILIGKLLMTSTDLEETFKQIKRQCTKTMNMKTAPEKAEDL